MEKTLTPKEALELIQLIIEKDSRKNDHTLQIIEEIAQMMLYRNAYLRKKDGVPEYEKTLKWYTNLYKDIKHG